MKNRKRKLQDSHVREHTIELVKANGACEIQFVANQQKMAWSTARALLLDLVREGKLRIMRTTGGFIFLPLIGDEDTPGAAQVKQRPVEVLAG